MNNSITHSYLESWRLCNGQQFLLLDFRSYICPFCLFVFLTRMMNEWKQGQIISNKNIHPSGHIRRRLDQSMWRERKRSEAGRRPAWAERERWAGVKNSSWSWAAGRQSKHGAVSHNPVNGAVILLLPCSSQDTTGVIHRYTSHMSLVHLWERELWAVQRNPSRSHVGAILTRKIRLTATPFSWNSLK